MNEITIKRGDSFSFKITLKDENNQPLNLALSEVQSQVRRKNGSLIQDLQIESTGSGEFKVFSLNTSGYPLETLEIDVRVKQAQESFATDTVLLRVERGVTVWK